MHIELNNDYLQGKCLDYFENTLIPTLKIIHSKSENFSDLINSLNQKDPTAKARLGWYLLVLEYLCNISTQDQRIKLIQKSIIDQDFNKLTGLDNKEQDLGIDVVYIDEKEDDKNAIVHLFNFKYRQNPDPKSGQSQKEALSSYDFLSTLINNPPGKNKGKTSKCINEILKVLNNCKTEVIFHMVSNDVNPLQNTQSIQTFSSSFGIKINSVTQQEIIDKILEKPKISCCFILNNKELFYFDERKGVKSIITKISALELIRISNTQADLRNIELISWSPGISELSSLEFEYGVLKDNVRGYIKNSINNSVVDTLDKAPNDFFMFNNGVTIVSSEIEEYSINLNKKTVLKLSDLQIVNGGQTLRNIYEYKAKLNDSVLTEEHKQKIKSNLEKTFVLIRIFSSSDSVIKSQIAQYTNTQTAITEGQLRAFNIEQKIIETELSNKGIHYVRKDGDLGEGDSLPKISMIQLAQILDSLLGRPYRASGRKQDLIESHYKEIFVNVSNDVMEYPLYINVYNKIYELLESVLSSGDKDNVFDKINFWRARRDSQNRFLDSIVMHILYIFKKENYLNQKKLENHFETSFKLLSDIISNLGLDNTPDINRKLTTQEIKVAIDKKIDLV